MLRTEPRDLNRYRAWLAREPVDRPMLGLFWEPDIPPLRELVERVGVGMEIRPEQIHPREFLHKVERWHQREAQVPGDVIQSFGSTLGMLWVQAVAGCPIIVQTDSFWAAPIIESYADRPPIHFDPDNPWVQKLIECTRAMVEFAASRFPVSLPVMHGPLDVLAAMRTSQRMCLDFYDHPAELFQVLGEISQLYVELADAVLEVIPPFRGGWVTRIHVWASDLAITPQNDTGALISADMYRRFVLPWDRFIIDHYPYSSYHLHSTSKHVFDLIVTLENVSCLQVSLEHDRGGSSLDVMLPAIHSLLVHDKPVLVVTWDFDAAERCLRELPWKGLCLTLAPPPFQDDFGEEYDRWLQEHIDLSK